MFFPNSLLLDTKSSLGFLSGGQKCNTLDSGDKQDRLGRWLNARLTLD